MNSTDKIECVTQSQARRDHGLTLVVILMVAALSFMAASFLTGRQDQVRIDQLVIENTNLRIERDDVNARLKKLEPVLRMANEMKEIK